MPDRADNDRGTGLADRTAGAFGQELLEGDAREILPTLAAGSFDAVVTDPAYWSLNRWREVGTTTRLGGHSDADKRKGWFATISEEDLYHLLCEFARVLPKNGHAWVCCDGETAAWIQGYQREGETGFGYAKLYPVIKLRADGAGLKPGMGYHGRATTEYVVLLEKGRRRFADENWPDCFFVPWTGDAETRAFTPNRKPYPTAKPLALFQRLIELSTAPGERVLDPFAGSGAALVAAQSLGRKATGIDVSTDALETCRRRLEVYRGVPLPRVRLHHIPVRGGGDGDLGLFDGRAYRAGG